MLASDRGQMTTTNVDRCRHSYHREFCPCPFGCHAAEIAALRGVPTTPEEVAHVVVVSEAMRGQTLQTGEKNQRRLKIEGKTLAGCKVGVMAADGTHNTRFHTEMSCGHMAIMAGTNLKYAHKKGQTLRCKPCQLAFLRTQRAARAAEAKG